MHCLVASPPSSYHSITIVNIDDKIINNNIFGSDFSPVLDLDDGTMTVLA
jgi:hypothetical protein